MATCIPEITDDLLFDCDNRDLQGIETNLVLINRNDIDFGTSVINATNSKIIDSIALKSGKTGYTLQGIKQLNSFLAEVVTNDEGLNRWRHNLNARVYNLTADARKQIDLIADGANLVAVLEKKWKGASQAHAFIVLGWGTGLEIAEGSENSNENDGSFVMRLASSELALEAEGPKNYLDTDYDTSSTAFGNKFAAA
tara:strand:+ start:253 stop:843 length:591 start_codon:yes stop_codon:yes gene_type:complete